MKENKLNESYSEKDFSENIKIIKMVHFDFVLVIEVLYDLIYKPSKHTYTNDVL